MSESHENRRTGRFRDCTSNVVDDNALAFKVKWKSFDPASVDDKKVSKNKNSLKEILVRSENRIWDSVKARLKGKYTGEIRVTYFDREGDEIPIESQCEFEELIKYCKSGNAIHELIVEKCGDTSTTTDKKENLKDLGKNGFACSEKTSADMRKSPNAMVSTDLGESVCEFASTSSRSCLDYSNSRPRTSGDEAPEWFTNYMQTMKDEIVTEVSQRVTKTVIDALTKKHETQSNATAPYVHVFDSDYLPDSDLDERSSLIEQESPNSSSKFDKKPADLPAASICLRSGPHRFEGPRRRFLCSEKQRKKHNKNHGFQPSNVDTSPHSHPTNCRRRGDKVGRIKRDATGIRPLAQNVERSELIPAEEGACAADSVGDEVKALHQRTTITGSRQTTPVLQDSADLLGDPIFKLPLADPRSADIAESRETEEKQRMGCSVVWQDIPERPNGRTLEYFSLSDSDNISIISDVSNNSDVQRINESFEMIHERSSTIIHDSEDDRIIVTELPQTGRAMDDLDNARDSSSFELLSEPPTSPPLSIHMDEDHFAPGTNESSNYNMNDETMIDKRGHQSKIDRCPYAIDAHGKIYQQNIIVGDEDCAEIILDKRTDGAYSFVGEALPTSTRESTIVTGKSGSAVKSAADDDLSKDADVEDVKEDPVKEDFVPNFGENFVNTLHESMQSFHSHTAQQGDDDRQDFAGSTSTEGREKVSTGETRSHVFVDRNASKGLGDTKKSSPKRRPSTRNATNEDSTSDNVRSNGKSSPDGKTSGDGNANSHNDRSKRFGDWATNRSSRMDDLVFNAVNPMQILPETLVTGAVHVAESAFTTARHVYDKILTTQMGDSGFRSQSKYGRRFARNIYNRH